MSRCEACGVETPIADAFQLHRVARYGARVHCCPTCIQREYERHGRKGLVTWFFVGAFGLFVTLSQVGPNAGAMILATAMMFLLQPITVILHELGHAVAGTLAGGTVREISIGSGRIAWQHMFGSVRFTLHRVPTHGFATVTFPPRCWLRLRVICLYAGGPLTNASLGAIGLALFPWTNITATNKAPFAWWGAVFAIANLVSLGVALWPRRVMSRSGRGPTDGLGVIDALRAPRSTFDAYVQAHWSFEVERLRHLGRLGEAISIIDREQARLPQDPHWPHYRSILLAMQGEYDGAVAILDELRSRDLQPLVRAYVLNSLAYTLLMAGGADRLERADRMSVEALALAGWIEAFNGTRGAICVARGEIGVGLHLLHRAFVGCDAPDIRALAACWIAIGERRVGHPAAARRFLDAARRLDPRCILLDRVAREIAGVPHERSMAAS
ncbi:MAG: M50 family metallopeptidase [Planctomycetes bacterium]|nr:M50 family metallopeptidase [Planctomycetota bacterium]